MLGIVPVEFAHLPRDRLLYKDSKIFHEGRPHSISGEEGDICDAKERLHKTVQGVTVLTISDWGKKFAKSVRDRKR